MRGLIVIQGIPRGITCPWPVDCDTRGKGIWSRRDSHDTRRPVYVRVVTGPPGASHTVYRALPDKLHGTHQPMLSDCYYHSCNATL